MDGDCPDIVHVNGYTIREQRVGTDDDGEDVFLSDVLDGDGDLADWL